MEIRRSVLDKSTWRHLTDIQEETRCGHLDQEVLAESRSGDISVQSNGS